MVATAPPPSGRLAWMAYRRVARSRGLALRPSCYFRAGPADALGYDSTSRYPAGNGGSSSFALSPDAAAQLVFAASGTVERLWLRPLDKTTALPLAGTEGPVFRSGRRMASPLAFSRAPVGLKRIDLAGGSAQDLGAVLFRSRPAVGPRRHDSVCADPATGPLFRIPARKAVAV